jgi:2-polyprenyl-6-methoxyphenol hydroxylase-like FAD-dependent oxidoreductase
MRCLMGEFRTEVLVIGAGPTGLFIAGELARHGVRPRIIEMAAEPHKQTRATEIQPGVLEVLHRSGLADKFLESSLPMKGLRVLDRNMEEAFVSLIPPAESPYPNTRSMPQWRTEEILADRLTALDIEVERGTTAREITASENGVQVECVDKEGRTFVIHADYLVGAGGAHSPVRGAFHLSLGGITYPRRYLVADVATKGVHGGNLIAVAISETGMVMTIELPNGRSLVLTDLPDKEIPDVAPGMEDVRTAIAAHLNRPFEVSDLRWASRYRMHRRMSPKFSKGRCFLVGDAAHICSPLGGEGLNAGILDGASLAWMLAAVLRRKGKPILLDAYEPERQEIARQILMSCDAMHGYYDTLIAMSAEGKPLSEPPDDPTRKVTSGSMLDLAIFQSPIIGFYGSALGVSSLRPGCRFPERTRLRGCLHHLLVYGEAQEWDQTGFAGRWADVLTVVDGNSICPPNLCGISVGGAILIRPDGYVGFQAEKWNSEARNALDGFLNAQFSSAAI